MLDKNIHKNILLQILKDIYSDTSLGPLLGFKGGTAAFLFYSLSRFSVDLDFDLIDETKEDHVFKKLENILKNYGEIKEKYNKRNTVLFILSYSKETSNIKIEINKRNFGSKYELKNYLGIPMLVMKKEDMFANKLVAATERGKTANRDIFDIWFFLKNNWQINKEIVEKRTKMRFKNYLQKIIGFIESMPEKSMLSGMGELLDQKTKSWVKENLKKDILFLLKIKSQEEK
ncbi:nucleotidyl transferase AbiEii/AbiGii toxin family protein [Patescibacteria group bacterium]|nr:nucleotidyl transferase AbiEii/AbiGii toxin family protein [Patescibacteria group bacterium]MBU2263068.1 nucleotidyl transferase AbiEii/AbiGii toxin family protein [Patescibacteria group bacterium]